MFFSKTADKLPLSLQNHRPSFPPEACTTSRPSESDRDPMLPQSGITSAQPDLSHSSPRHRGYS